MGTRKELDMSQSEAITGGLNKNFGQFLLLSGMYSINKSYRLVFPILYVSALGPTIITMFYSVYLLQDEPSACFECLHFSVLLGTCMIAVLNAVTQRDEVELLLEALGRDFYDYGDTLDEYCLKEYAKNLKEARNRKSILSYGLSIAVFFTALILGCRPLFNYIFDARQHHDPKLNVIEGLIVDVYYPIDPNSTSSYVAVLLMQYLIYSLTPGIVLGADVFVISVAEEFAVHFRLLETTLKRIGERAAYVMVKNKRTGKDGFDHSVHECIVHSVKHHQALIKAFKNFNRLYFSLLIMIVLSSTVMLCLSSYAFLSDQVSVLSKTMFLLFLICEVVHTFIYCYYGDKISDHSSNIRWAVYQSSWPSLGPKIRIDILLIQMRCLRPLGLSAGGFMFVDLKTFSNIINQAFSYFNLLRAAKV